MRVTQVLSRGAWCSPPWPDMGRLRKSPLQPCAEGARTIFWAKSLALECAAPQGAPRMALKVSSADSSLELKAEARGACQVVIAALFVALLITAIAFAGEYQGFHLLGNVSEVLPVVAVSQIHLPAPREDAAQPQMPSSPGEGLFTEQRSFSTEDQTHLPCAGADVI